MYADKHIGDEGDLVHMALFAGAEPIDKVEALKKPEWRNVIKEEINSIEKNGTWKLVDLRAGKKCIGVKWVFKQKLKPDGSISKHKARLVEKGFLQRKRLYFS